MKRRGSFSILLLIHMASLNTSFSTCQTIQRTSPRVAVVGCGLAGLTAAYRLVQQGYDVVAYEAKGRVGGRAFSVLIEDEEGNQRPAELGAQFINDGGEALCLKRLAKELGVCIEYAPGMKWSLKYWDGTRITFPGIRFKEYGFTKAYLWDYLEMLRDCSVNMDDVLQKLFQDDEILYKSFSLMVSCYEGGDTKKLSLLCIDTLYRMLSRELDVEKKDAFYGEFPYVVGGNSRLPEELAKRLAARVHLNHVLTGVTKDNEGVFTLRFQDKGEVQVDIIILAVPCTVYQDIAFGEGVIPQEQLKTIQNVCYGGNAKILVPVIYKETTFKSNDSTRACGCDRALAYQVKPEDPVTLYYCEPYGNFTADTFKEIYMRDISLVSLGHTISPFLQEPCLARDENFAAYKAVVGWSWPSDPFARGSYSYLAAGQEAIFIAQSTYVGLPIRTLFMPAGNVFFAGEHTTIHLDILGTMEAAISSGEEVVQSIIAMKADIPV